MSRDVAAPSRAGGVLVLRRGGFSVRLGVRAVVVGALAWAIAVAVALRGTVVGDYPMPLATVLDTIAGNGTLITYDVVVRHRIPRAIVGVLVGAAFGVSGAIFQRLAHNPLVSPDVIGINAGAAAGAVLVILVFGGTTGWVTAGALIGAGVAASLVYGIARRGGFSGYRLVLVGVGVAAILASASTFLLSRADTNEAMRAAAWQVGSLASRTWPDVLTAALAIGLLVPAALVLSRSLRLLELGDDLARTLSPRIEPARVGLLAAAVGLAALATAASGPIGFVALVAPQIVRRLLRERSAGLLPSAGVGALVVVSADLVARTAFSPYELPVGVLTALVGAPLLVYLLVRANRIGASG
ncbi:MAG: iron chelate uptake ABC transporter family permease subunit [Pseudonocardia sp.]|nr:iron chelate uptake ABC transporter family permease subunit [Pseudonocardia sp.]